MKVGLFKKREPASFPGSEATFFTHRCLFEPSFPFKGNHEDGGENKKDGKTLGFRNIGLTKKARKIRFFKSSYHFSWNLWYHNKEDILSCLVCLATTIIKEWMSFFNLYRTKLLKEQEGYEMNPKLYRIKHLMLDYKCES